MKRKFRLLTYNCESRKHVIRIWMEANLDLIREVKCHQVCDNKGYDDKAKGTVVVCPEGDHKLLLQGTEKQ